MGPTTRFTAEMEELASGIKRILTKGSEKQLIFLITRSPVNVPKETIGIIKDKIGLPDNKIFYFDFECLYANDPSLEKDSLEFLQNQWRKNYDKVRELLKEVVEYPLHVTEDFGKLKKQRNELFKSIALCYERMSEYFLSFSNQSNYIKELMNLKQNINISNNYQITEKVATGKVHKNVFVCMDCLQNCFQADGDGELNEKTMMKQIKHKTGIYFFRKSVCKMCDHSWYHHKQKVQEETIYKDVIKNDERLKKIFETNTKRTQELEQLQKEEEEKLKMTNDSLNELFKELGEKYASLNEIAFESYDPSTEILSLIEKFKRPTDPEFNEKLGKFIKNLEIIARDSMTKK